MGKQHQHGVSKTNGESATKISAASVSNNGVSNRQLRRQRGENNSRQQGAKRQLAKSMAAAAWHLGSMWRRAGQRLNGDPAIGNVSGKINENGESNIGNESSHAASAAANKYQ